MFDSERGVALRIQTTPQSALSLKGGLRPRMPAPDHLPVTAKVIAPIANSRTELDDQETWIMWRCSLLQPALRKEAACGPWPTRPRRETRQPPAATQMPLRRELS